MITRCLLLLPLLSPPPATRSASADDGFDSQLGRLAYWDDGLAEMCYYDARVTIDGAARTCTRVQIVVRQWNDAISGVRTAEADDANALPVLKLVVAEQIPTERYNYRFLTTLFVHRFRLTPLKLTVSTQDWLGTTYKHLRWQDGALRYLSFSYQPSEGENLWEMADGPWPVEAGLVFAREIVASGRIPAMPGLLPPLATPRQVPPPALAPPRWRVGADEELRVPAGTFNVRRVRLDVGADNWEYSIESAPPHRVIRYAHGDETGELRSFEKRAYWDADTKSNAYRPGAAP